MVRWKRWSRWLPSFAVTLVIGLLAACKETKVQPIQMYTLGLRECPHSWFWDSLPSHVPALSGPITNVPEFNDCQRFIRTDGVTYDSLYAVFAAADLEARFARLQKHQVDSGSYPFAIAVGEVWSDGGTYDLLGLHPGFNCLFLYYASGALTARMKPVGLAEKDCVAASYNLSSLAGPELAVRRNTKPGYTSADIPKAAKWDWDRAHSWQYVGIGCGDAWCEVGPKIPAIFNSSTAHPAALAASTAARRVVEIKGWYDEQRLLEPNALGGTGHPGLVFGTAIPDTGLGTYKINPDFQHRWQHAARLELGDAFPPLLNKWSIPASAGRGPFEVSLCEGSKEDCGVPAAVTPASTCTSTPSWWARIGWVDAMGQPGSVYRCVNRVDHAAELAAAGLTLPGTVRWRWIPDDETLWMRCDAGCCTVY